MSSVWVLTFWVYLFYVPASRGFTGLELHAYFTHSSSWFHKSKTRFHWKSSYIRFKMKAQLIEKGKDLTQMKILEEGTKLF